MLLMDWMELAQDREILLALANAVMNVRIPLNAGNFWTSWKPVSISRRTVLHGVIKYVRYKVNKFNNSVWCRKIIHGCTDRNRETKQSFYVNKIDFEAQRLEVLTGKKKEPVQIHCKQLHSHTSYICTLATFCNIIQSTVLIQNMFLICSSQN